jgi:hypothetical protein
MSVFQKNLLTVGNALNMPRSSWNSEGAALVAEVLRGAFSFPRAPRTMRLRVHGESMLPSLWPGDVVEIASCSLDEDDLRPGEIVLAMRDGRLFLHRLVAPCTPNGFTLLGDSMPGCDPSYPPEALLGRLVRRVDHEGAGFSSPVFCRLLGRVFCHCGVARRLALTIHRRRNLPAGELRNLQSI